MDRKADKGIFPCIRQAAGGAFSPRLAALTGGMIGKNKKSPQRGKKACRPSFPFCGDGRAL